MAREVKITCDCGCGQVTAEDLALGWFRLNQLVGAERHQIKLIRDLFFSSVDCLERWIRSAVDAADQLRVSARASGLSRGTFVDDKTGLKI